jgi:hypothetical protein
MCEDLQWGRRVGSRWPVNQRGRSGIHQQPWFLGLGPCCLKYSEVQFVTHRPKLDDTVTFILQCRNKIIIERTMSIIWGTTPTC